jgi:hypothetical protein
MRLLSQFEELSICLKVENQNLPILNPEFLQSQSIVPTDWQLAESSLFELSIAQIEFTNGISIGMESHKVTFSQNINGKMQRQIEIPEITRNYVARLPEVEYEEMEVKITTFMTFGAKTYSFCYIPQVLASEWQEQVKEPVLATLELNYTLERGKFKLKIDDVKLRNLDDRIETGVLFSGKFQYDVTSDRSLERMKKIYLILEHWRYDLMLYRHIINEKFLYRQLVDAN